LLIKKALGPDLLIKEILPSVLEDHFVIVSNYRLGDIATKTMELHIELDEKNDLPIDHSRSDYESKGFLPSVQVQDFPIRGKAVYQRSQLWNIMQNTGAQALPIVSLVSLLVGLILAFVGAVELKEFGAGVYMADLVGIAMTREMGAIMTGIIMAGRTGAAFAAELGSMTVNQEIDALQTAGFSTMEFLVLPRMVALMLMMPLLTVYADVMGILGGLLVAIPVLDMDAGQYFMEIYKAVSVADFLAGIFMASVYGVIVAVVGCMRGISCGRSAQAVGTATTSAVVSSIVLIVVACAIMTVLFNALGL